MTDIRPGRNAAWPVCDDDGTLWPDGPAFTQDFNPSNSSFAAMLMTMHDKDPRPFLEVCMDKDVYDNIDHVARRAEFWAHNIPTTWLPPDFPLEEHVRRLVDLVRAKRPDVESHLCIGIFSQPVYRFVVRCGSTSN